MTKLVSSELLKLRSTRTTIALGAAMVVLVVLAVALHGYGLGAERFNTASGQLSLLIGWGEVLGALFAGLLGALCFTGEIQHGTIRPTLLVTPRRGRVIAAKAAAVAAGGLGLGLAATLLAVAAGRVVLAARGLDVALNGGDYALFVLGGTAAAALWAVVGLGVGALVRGQVPTVVGVLAWVLFVEGILVETLPGVGRFAPAALGQAVAGLHADTLLAPGVAAVLLVGYAAAALGLGTIATTRRDLP